MFGDVPCSGTIHTVNTQLQQKLKQLPKTPGVYFHKDKSGTVIYVGKAAILKNRVRQYFQASRNRDPKTEALVAEIVDTDWIEVESEVDALFLEAEWYVVTCQRTIFYCATTKVYSTYA